MTIDRETVQHVARLARIHVDDRESDLLANELSMIMTWIDQLEEVDTDGVVPVRSVMEIETVLRPDMVTDGNKSGDILANAPKTHQSHFVVPKVIE